MTAEQSKQLKVGDHVCFNGEHADHGRVTAIEERYVTIKWDDGHKSIAGHKDMKRIERIK